MISATVSINVPALPENDIWFANAQAWNNYWRNITADVDVGAASTSLYAPVAYDTSLQYVQLTIDGIPVGFATNDMFTSLLAKLEALDASYQQLRTDLKAAGFIDNAQ